MSTSLRRSARLAQKAETPVRSAPVAVPTAPKKVRIPKQPSAAELARAERLEQIFADQEEAARLIDSRIKSALDDLAVWERLGDAEIHRNTLMYLFEGLFASVHFQSLGYHHEHTDVMFNVVQNLHLSHEDGNDYVAPLFTRPGFIHGYNTICFFLHEVGFPSSEFMRAEK